MNGTMVISTAALFTAPGSALLIHVLLGRRTQRGATATAEASVDVAILAEAAGMRADLGLRVTDLTNRLDVLSDLVARARAEVADTKLQMALMERAKDAEIATLNAHVLVLKRDLDLEKTKTRRLTTRVRELEQKYEPGTSAD